MSHPLVQLLVEEFTEDELLDLAFLVHDKGHLRGGYGAAVPGIEKALATLSEPAPVLWRAPHKTLDISELRAGGSFAFSGYTSWSESESFVRTMAGPILKLTGATAYPYWKHWTQVQLDHPHTDHYIVQMLDKEREWITPRGFSCQVVEIDGDTVTLSASNLQLLFPNCHSLTPNHGSRNKGRGRVLRNMPRASA